MNIVVDCRYVRVGPPDGISRYTIGLVTALTQLNPVTVLVSDRRQLDHLPSLPHVLVSDPTSVREPWVARQVNRLRPDVVFSPMQTMGPRLCRVELHPSAAATGHPARFDVRSPILVDGITSSVPRT